jgi:hypothetical protein
VVLANVVLYMVFWWSLTLEDSTWLTRLLKLAGDPRIAPWSMLTFGLLEPRVLMGPAIQCMVWASVIVSCLVCIFWMGGDLEKSWGTPRYALFLAGTSATSYLVVYTVTRHSLTGPAPLLANLILAWLTQNRDYQLRVMFMFTLTLGFFRWVTLGLVLLSTVFYAQPVVLGFSALAGPLLSWWWASKLRPQKARPQFQVIDCDYEDEEDEDEPTWVDSEIDRILDKIAKEGMNALTAQERDLLDSKSQQLRRGGA